MFSALGQLTKMAKPPSFTQQARRPLYIRVGPHRVAPQQMHTEFQATANQFCNNRHQPVRNLVGFPAMIPHNVPSLPGRSKHLVTLFSEWHWQHTSLFFKALYRTFRNTIREAPQ